VAAGVVIVEAKAKPPARLAPTSSGVLDACGVGSGRQDYSGVQVVRVCLAIGDAVRTGGVDADGDDEVDSEPDVEPLAEIDHVKNEEAGYKYPENNVDREWKREAEMLVPGEEEGDAGEDEGKHEEPEGQHRSGEAQDDFCPEEEEQGIQVERWVKQRMEQGWSPLDGLGWDWSCNKLAPGVDWCL
jgi:hypothetical protein